MARVYSGSRLMLDPNYVLAARREADNREAARRDVRRGIAKGIGDIGGAVGGAIELAQEQKAKNIRRDIMAGAPDSNDPEYRAAVERFVETGDIGGLNAYRTLKEGRERSAREAAQRERELGIRQQEAKAMAEKTALEDAKIKQGLVEKAKLDLQEAEIELKNATTGADRERAKVNIQRALLDLKNAGQDVSGYVYPTEGGTETATTTTTDGEGGGKSIKAQINDLRTRLDAGFKTNAEKAAFVAEVQEKRTGAKGAEVDEFVKLLSDAGKVKTAEEKTGESVAAKKKKAKTYAEKSASPAEFFVWFNKLSDKEKDEYESAFKEYGGE